MQTAREFLTQYSAAKGYSVDEDTLIETLVEEGKIVWRGVMDEHRWYIIQPVVKDIDGTFIQYDDYIITGDNSMRDMDLQYDLDSAKVVERKERTVVEVYYE